jgi:ribosomal protein S18 acetylase RimI-like enzyme
MTMTSDIWIIRPARVDDEVRLAEIYLSVRRSTFRWVDPARFHREDFPAHSQGERVFVCEDGESRIAGFLALWEPGDFIHMLYILPACQGRGAGKALLNALPDWPDRRYRLKCLMRNTRALAFYRGLGFEIVGQGSSTEGEYKDMQLPDPRDG